MAGLCRFAGVVIAWAVAGLQPAGAATACAQAPVQVQAPDPADAATACEGAGDAVAFFRSLGLKVSEGLHIEVRRDLPEAVSRSAAGCFLEPGNRVLLVPYAAFRRHKDWFRVPVDRRMYRSLAAHEVAHALAACNFRVARPTIQAKEYVAYVAMLATMEAATRARILQAYPEPAFDSADRLTPLLHAFDPMRFGVQSYRHFAQPGNGAAFLAAVFAGTALTD
jgi:hypothetical protein